MPDRWLGKILMLAVVPALTCCSGASRPGIEIGELRCEYRENPAGIDDAFPRLSRNLSSKERGQAQSAWQILVARSPAILKKDKGDAWDSGKITGSESHFIVYQGQELESRKIYFWKVRVWDAHGRVSGWSKPARWEMGLLDPGDWSGAKWIDDGKPGPQTTEEFYADDPAPLFRKEFGVEKKVARARLYITGLGFSADGMVKYERAIGQWARDIRPGTHAWLKIINDRHQIWFYYSSDGENWVKHPGGAEVSGYHHNTIGYFLSLRAGIIAAGTGSVTCHYYKYTGLD